MTLPIAKNVAKSSNRIINQGFIRYTDISNVYFIAVFTVYFVRSLCCVPIVQHLHFEIIKVLFL